jgi:hypothetical protein
MMMIRGQANNCGFEFVSVKTAVRPVLPRTCIPAEVHATRTQTAFSDYCVPRPDCEETGNQVRRFARVRQDACCKSSLSA